MYQGRCFKYAMTDLQLFNEYKDMWDDDVWPVTKYFLDKHRRSSNLFQKSIRKAVDEINGLTSNNTLTDADTLKNLIDTKCSGTLISFAIYHKYNIKDFVATKIVTNFCKKKIDEVLTKFSRNIDMHMYCLSGDAKKLYDEIMKIHFVVTAAQIFSVLNFIKQNNLNMKKCLPAIVPLKGNFISENLFNKCLMTDNSHIMTDNSVTVDIDEKRGIGLFFDKLVLLYGFITNRSVEELNEFSQQNPDFAVLICRYLDNKSHISTSYIYKYLIKAEFFYLCDIIATKSIPKKNGDIFNIKNDIFPQDNLLIEI